MSQRNASALAVTSKAAGFFKAPMERVALLPERTIPVAQPVPLVSGALSGSLRKSRPLGEIASDMLLGRGRGSVLAPLAASGAAGGLDYLAGDDPKGALETAGITFAGLQPWTRRFPYQVAYGKELSTARAGAHGFGVFPEQVAHAKALPWSMAGGALMAIPAAAALAGKNFVAPAIGDAISNAQERGAVILNQAQNAANTGAGAAKELSEVADKINNSPALSQAQSLLTRGNQAVDVLQGVEHSPGDPVRGHLNWWGKNKGYFGYGALAAGGAYTLAKVIQGLRSEPAKKKPAIPAGVPGAAKRRPPKITLKHPGFYQINLDENGEGPEDLALQQRAAEVAKAACDQLMNLL